MCNHVKSEALLTSQISKSNVNTLMKVNLGEQVLTCSLLDIISYHIILSD